MEMIWQFKLFGKPEIWYQENQIEDFNTQKAKALLFYLITEGGKHNRNKLARFFWDDFNLISSQNNLRTALYHLNKDFETCLQIDRLSISFHLPETAYLDLAILDAIHQEDDISALEAAAIAYRGDFLENFSCQSPQFEDWKAKKQSYYRNLMIGYLLQLANLHKKAHHLNEGLKITQQIFSIQPFNESAVLLRMRLFSGLGQIEQAIQEYHDYQDFIKDLPDALPSPLITSAYNDLKGNLSSPPTIKLPHSLTTFFGREDEITHLTNQIVDPSLRLINLVGASGIGKTRLGIRAVELVASHFSDGVYYIDLGVVHSSQDNVSIDNLSKILLYILNRDSIIDKSYSSQLVDALKNMNALLLFDNFKPAKWREAFFTTMLETIPNIKLFVISREKVNIPGAVTMVLDGLGYPSQDDMPSTFNRKFVNSAPSLQLFEDRARHVHPDFVIDKSNYRQVAHICRIVHGLPMGIEYFANLLESKSLEEIIQVVTSDSSETNDSPPTAQLPDSLRKIFDFAWEQLDPNLQEIAQACSLFIGIISIEAYQALFKDSMDKIPLLIGASILQESIDGKYLMHNYIQTYLSEKRSQFKDKYKARFSTYFLNWLIELDKEAECGPYPLETVRLENLNFVTAWQLALKQGQYRLLMRSCGQFSRAFRQLGMSELAYKHLRQTAQWLDVLPEKSDLQRMALCRVWLELGSFEEQSGNLPRSSITTEKAHKIAQTFTDTSLLAESLQRKAAISILSGDVQLAKKYAYDGLTNGFKSDNQRLIATGIITLSEAYCRIHEFQKARKIFKAAFDEKLIKDNSRMMQTLLLKLSLCEKDQGNFRLSMVANKKAQLSNHTFLDLHEEGMLAFARGSCHKFMGQVNLAFDEFERAGSAFARINHTDWQARSLANLAILYFWKEKYESALEQLYVVEKMASKNKLLMTEIIALKARLLLSVNKIEQARACLSIENALSPSGPSLYITAARIDLAIAEQADDKAYDLAVSTLPNLKNLYYDQIDDPFAVYLSVYQALKDKSPDAAIYVLRNAKRELSLLQIRLNTAEEKKALFSIPHRKELNCIIWPD